MKKLFLIISLILSLFCFDIQATFALDYSRISTNAKIVAALDSLYSINRKDVIAILNGNNATRKPIRVMFRDLAMFGYDDAEAITAPTKKQVPPKKYVLLINWCSCLNCTNKEISAPTKKQVHPYYISRRFISASTMFVSSTNCSTESCSGRFVMMSCA